MKKTITTILAIVVLNSVMVTPSFAVTVRGGGSCGAWVAERAMQSVLSNGIELWLLGYLSGLGVSWNKDILKGTDNPSIFLWVDNHCKANPLNGLDKAGEVLFYELVKQKKL